MNGRWTLSPPEQVHEVTIDSRQAGNGSLFVALQGKNTHGHRYVADAREQGATAALVEEVQPCSVPQFVVEDSRRAFQRLARTYHRWFTNSYTIAITGTCGKTTLTRMLGDLLERNYLAERTPGNYNNLLGLPLTLFNHAHGNVVVAEIATNSPSEIATLTEWLRPHMGIITHVGEAHLKGLGTVEAVAEEKADLFAGLPRDGLALAPARVMKQEVLENRSTVKPLFLKNGMENPFSLEWSVGENQSELRFNDRVINLSFGGEGLVQDAALGVAAAGLLGVPEEEIKQCLETFRPLEGRGQLLNVDGCQVIDGTYNANPASMDEALNRLSSLQPPRLIILGDMKELGEAAPHAHRELGRKVDQIDPERIIFVGENRGAFCAGLSSQEAVTALESVEEVPPLNFGRYRSALIKASNAVGLSTVLDRTESR